MASETRPALSRGGSPRARMVIVDAGEITAGRCKLKPVETYCNIYVEIACLQRSKQKYYKLLSSFAFKSNLRHYITDEDLLLDRNNMNAF